MSAGSIIVRVLRRRVQQQPSCRRLLSIDKAVADMRLDHGGTGLQLVEDKVGSEPLPLFHRWFQAASNNPKVIEANAMALATVDQESKMPSCRVVLLKGVDERGFTWFTNYTSRKGKELAGSGDGSPAFAALTFWWPAMERQVRVEGSVEKVSAEETAEYFLSRPRGSQIGAWASRQSSVIESAEALAAREAALTERWGGGGEGGGEGSKDIPVPDFWGGFRLAPRRIEFWQGRASRLHDRIAFSRQTGGATDAGGWTRERLCP